MKKLTICLGVMLLAAVPAQAVNLSLHPANQGIDAGTFNWWINGNDIHIEEVWTSSGPGFVQFEGLPISENYVIYKYVTNNTGADWTSFANELLDPAGTGPDDDGDQAIEPWVPVGFSHSTEDDGLSFAQGSGIPRTSDVFASLVVDELATRDFLDFYDGILVAGGNGVFSYGLRDNYEPAQNQPFLLTQRPNEFTQGPNGVIPEPGTLLLVGFGLAGGALSRRFRKKA